jgi:hypothetical protein
MLDTIYRTDDDDENNNNNNNNNNQGRGFDVFTFFGSARNYFSNVGRPRGVTLSACSFFPGTNCLRGSSEVNVWK